MMQVRRWPGGYCSIIDPDELNAPVLRELRQYWDAKRAGRPMPRRSDIDPLELRGHLTRLFMMNVLPGGEDYRYRLVGTAITSRFGRDSTGKTVRQIYGAGDPQIFRWYWETLKELMTLKRPVLCCGPMRAVEKEYLGIEAYHLPLSDDGAEVDVILGETRFLTLADAPAVVGFGPGADARESGD